MYVHDAIYTHGGDTEEPMLCASTSGRLVLPKSTSTVERGRVLQLFEKLFRYIRSSNELVDAFITAAEALFNMEEEDIEQSVLVLYGRRSQEAIRQEAAGAAGSSGGDVRNGDGGRLPASPFAVAAGGHARLFGMPGVCVLCPRLQAANEEYKVLVSLRDGGLRDIGIDNRLFDALYHVVLHPTGYVGWEVGLPLRTKAEAFRTLPEASRTGGGPRGSSALHPRDTLSMCDYYAYRLHYRRGHLRTDNCLFMASRLFQEYVCVAFWRIESARLNAHRLKQEEMRLARVEELRQYADIVMFVM